MRYLILSDTHGKTNEAIKAIETEKCDYCIHLGDMVRDCEDLQSIFPNQKFIFVKGNNDFWIRDSQFPDMRIFNLENKRFFVCHGHKFHVKQGPEELIVAAKKENADIVLFGHTHRRFFREVNGMTIINPGAYGNYAIITIDGDNIKYEAVCDDE